MARRWTDDDDIYLEYFIFSKDRKLQEAAEFLGRSLSATISRAAFIRKKRKEYYICRKWTTEEDNYIKANYKLVSYQSIGLRLGRSKRAVSERVRHLGLRKNNSLISLDREIRKMADKGEYPVNIARKLNLDYETLRDYLNKHSITYLAMPSEESLKKAREKSPWNKCKINF